MNSIPQGLMPKKEVYRFRVKRIVSRLMKQNQIFREELEQDEIVESLTDTMQKFSVEEFLAIDEDDMRKRLGGMIALNMLSKISDDFTPKQKKIFNEAVRWSG